MPRLKESPKEKKDRMLLALIAKNRVLCNVGGDCEFSTLLGISAKTLYRKMKDPDKFTRRELRKIFSTLKFSEEEKSQVV